MSHPQLTALVFSSNPEHASIVAACLAQGVNACVAAHYVATLREGLAWLAAAPTIDAIISEETLRDSHGLELLHCLRLHAPQAAIVVLTDTADDAAALEYLQHGAQDGVPFAGLDARGISRTLRRAVARKRHAVAEHAQDLREVTFLSKAATGFVELAPNADIFAYIGDCLRELVGDDAIICISSYDEATNCFHVYHILGIDKDMQAIISILGRFPSGLTFTPTDEARLNIGSGNLIRLSGGLHELTFGKYSPGICRMLERVLNLGDIYVGGFTHTGGVFGDAVLLLRQGVCLEHRDTIQAFLNLSSIALQRWQAEAELRTLPLVDDLTELYNRRGFFMMAEQQMKIARRTNRGLVCLYVDVDNLKWINDTFGHHCGDAALTETATLFKECFRTSDVLARMGGDEFVVLMVDSVEADGRRLTQRLQEHLQRHNEAKCRPFQLDLSIGSAYHDPKSPATIDELLAKADRLMYSQKRIRKHHLNMPFVDQHAN
ncbi:MAG TPA: diguanylate cyclase [Armatimonadota bacterium]|jgi:diguanylate cyclase (GGDEF)-like protein